MAVVYKLPGVRDKNQIGPAYSVKFATGGAAIYGHLLVIATPGGGTLNDVVFSGGCLEDEGFGGDIA